MKYVVGLGNPTEKYRNTRHNIGFSVVERTAELAADRRSKRSEAQSSGTTAAPLLKRILRCLHSTGGSNASEWRKWHNMLLYPLNAELTLIKPQTYMNLSGEVFEYLEKVEPENILVVVDDIYLPLGRMRFRSKGSSGGHNGLKSIENLLGNKLYQRVKIGVGRVSDITAEADGAESEDLIDFVLGEFEQEESELLQKVVLKGAEAVLDWYTGGMEYVQQQYNGIDLRF